MELEGEADWAKEMVKQRLAIAYLAWTVFLEVQMLSLRFWTQRNQLNTVTLSRSRAKAPMQKESKRVWQTQDARQTGLGVIPTGWLHVLAGRHYCFSASKRKRTNVIYPQNRVLFMHSPKVGVPLHVFARPCCTLNPPPRSYRNRTLHFALMLPYTRPDLLRFSTNTSTAAKAEKELFLGLLPEVGKMADAQGNSSSLSSSSSASSTLSVVEDGTEVKVCLFIWFFSLLYYFSVGDCFSLFIFVSDCWHQQT